MNIMKSNGPNSLVILSLILIIQLLALKSFAQPDYIFNNHSLVAGTDKQVGAVYRFTTVKPGVDAIVTIQDISGGIVLNQLDGGSGFTEAFQPVLQVPPHTSGYVEFRIDFVEEGTNTPMTQIEVPATPIDVDGIQYASGNVYEFDVLTMAPGAYVDYNMLGGELQVIYSAGWVTGKNIAAIDYPGVDTVAKQAMFTTVNPSITSFVFRTGAENNSDQSAQRLRSLYFKKFQYEHSFLSRSPLTAFAGKERNNGVELSWQLSADNNVSRIVIEKGSKPNQFTSLREISAAKNVQTGYTYFDNEAITGTRYYRLKIIQANGLVIYSTVLVFRETQSTQPFQVYPTQVNQSATIAIQARKSETATIQLVDLNGRVVLQKPVNLMNGSNNVLLSGLASLSKGFYVATIRMSEYSYSQKIIKQ